MPKVIISLSCNYINTAALQLQFLVFLFMCFCNYAATAQSVRYPLAVPYTGLSAYSVKQNDVFSFTGNQAALAKTMQAGTGMYAERRFLLAAINNYNLAAVLPTKMGNFGMQVNYAGFKNFNENKVGLAYARSLGNKVDVGIQFNYYGYRIPGYNSASAIYAEAGMLLHLTEKLNAGVHFYNPVGGKLSTDDDEKLASVYKFGLGYDASDNFFISGEIVKEEDKPVNVIAGFQYQFAKQFFARAGFLSESSSPYAGAGVSWKNFRIDVAGSYHPQLGLSPAILLLVNFEQKK
jgi:hypothetical protein